MTRWLLVSGDQSPHFAEATGLLSMLTKDGRMEIWKDGKTEGWKDGRKDGRFERRKEGKQKDEWVLEL